MVLLTLVLVGGSNDNDASRAGDARSRLRNARVEWDHVLLPDGGGSTENSSTLSVLNAWVRIAEG